MRGELVCATAIAEPLGLKATSLPAPVGSVAGSVYTPRNPPLPHEYTVTKGVVLCATANALGAVLPSPEVFEPNISIP